MRLGGVSRTYSSFLNDQLSENKKEFGQKLQAFSKQAHSKFERYLLVKLSQDYIERQKILLAIYAAVIFTKYFKVLHQRNDSFFHTIKEKSQYKQILKKNPGYNIEGLLNLIEAKVTSSEIKELNSAEDRTCRRVLQLLCDIAEINSKNESQAIAQEQIQKISKFFVEDICFLNYDKTKDCLKNIEIKAHRLYILKAKKLFFILIKQEQIIRLNQSSITHQQFADIFDIRSKLEVSILKQGSKIASPKKKDEQQKYTEISLKSNIKELSVSRIKSSVIFPENIKCHICCKQSSQFNAVFWNYAYSCVECVLNPQKDTSFIPGNIIDKFLKGQNVQFKEYQTTCPECKSETAIPKYKPSNKPKSYRCGVCMKEICIEHQQMIIQCFCQCKCGKKTLSIPHIYVKYCLSCKIRLCELCGSKSDKECSCICQQCGQNKKVDHQVCSPTCSGCKAREIQLIKCQCQLKLCPKCFYSHFQPGPRRCLLFEEQPKI